MIAHLTKHNQGRAIQIVTTTLTSTNFLALSIIIALAFTKTLPRTLATLTFIRHFTIVAALLFLALLALPFMTLYCLICHRMFPPKYRKVLYWDKDFGNIGYVLYRFYWYHRDKLRAHWRGLKEVFAAIFGGGWKKVKVLIGKSTEPDTRGAQAV